MSKKIKAFIFDLDGVITDTAEYHYEAWRKFAKEIGITIDRTFNERLKGISRVDAMDLILEYGGKLSDYSEEEKLELADKKNQYFLESINDITPDDILPGIKEVIELLKKSDMKIGLASASRNAKYILEKLKLVHEFDYIADSSKIKNGKPNPEIFIKVADKLQVLYEQCVGIEDAKSGVKAIKDANMIAIGIGNKEVLKQADFIINSTEELNHICKTLSVND